MTLTFVTFSDLQFFTECENYYKLVAEFPPHYEIMMTSLYKMYQFLDPFYTLFGSFHSMLGMKKYIYLFVFQILESQNFKS